MFYRVKTRSSFWLRKWWIIFKIKFLSFTLAHFSDLVFYLFVFEWYRTDTLLIFLHRDPDILRSNVTWEEGVFLEHLVSKVRLFIYASLWLPFAACNGHSNCLWSDNSVGALFRHFCVIEKNSVLLYSTLMLY